MKIPENLTGKALYKWLVENKSLLEAAKKAETKKADGFTMMLNYKVTEKGDVVKAETEVAPDATKMDAVLIINTTNLMDSHKDVHIPGIWKKSLQEAKVMYLCKEHIMSFETIISEDVKAVTKKMSWRELGYDADGYTEALVFNTVLDKQRHPYMFEQYRKGYVKNHSVGMRYVRLKMAINDEDYPEEYANWTDYIDQVVNRSDAEASGYFWPVLEAKVIEGSAVVKGSNWITPTQSISQSKKESTEGEPLHSTPTDQPHDFDLNRAIKEFKIFS